MTAAKTYSRVMFAICRPKRGESFLRIALAIGCLAGLALAQDAGNCTSHDTSTRPDCSDATAFFEKFQAALKTGDKTQLASMVNYPLRVSRHGQRIIIRNQEQFLRSYSQLFTPAVICAVEAAKPSDVWGNYQGFMVAQGVIWWDQIIPASAKNPEATSGKYPFKIIAVNSANIPTSACGKEKP